MKYKIIASRRFRKSFKRINKSGDFDLEKYHRIVRCLMNGENLPTRNYDHLLQGDWAGYRECHIESDMLLIYEISETESTVFLIDIGSHSNLFG